jgi:hypothetical protein
MNAAICRAAATMEYFLVKRLMHGIAFAGVVGCPP